MSFLLTVVLLFAAMRAGAAESPLDGAAWLALSIMALILKERQEATKR